MAFGNFSPGSYSVTYGGNALGLVTNPHRFRMQSHAEPITVDLYGDSVVDGVYRGRSVFVLCTFEEWTANLRSAINPFDADFGDTGLHGRLLSDIAAALVLTPVAATPAATEGTNTFTLGSAIIAPENDVEFLLGNVRRSIPILFEGMMYLDTAVPRHFSVA